MNDRNELTVFQLTVTGRGSSPHILQAEYNNRTHSFRPIGPSGAVYFHSLADGWVCFIWRADHAAALARQGRTTVAAVVLPFATRRALGIDVGGKNLADILGPLLK